MDRPLTVLFLSTEVSPLAKTGGLADVAGSLPKALKALGIDIRVALPYYRTVKESPSQAELVIAEMETPVGRDMLRDRVYLTRLAGGVPVYLINKDEYFDRRFLYGTSRGDYFDNLERFVFFSRAVFNLCEKLDFQPDVIHCNDWQTGLVPAYLETLYRTHPLFAGTACLFTVHNIAYQGLFPGEKFQVTGLPSEVFHPGGIEFWGGINLLKSGLVFSQIITTVSRRYSREIQTPEFGYGLEGVVRSRKGDLFGVLNGVDYTEWNPESDRLIAANYTARNLRGKMRCKDDLLGEFNLPERLRSRPIIGIISRLVKQKGFDLVEQIIEDLMEKDLGLVVLGTGESAYEELFVKTARKYPGKAAARIAYDNRLAHKIEAGADMFLMPSRYEPCGLNQIFSLKYGTVPIVRATGGLDDTIVDYRSETGRGTGFKFKQYRPSRLLQRIEDALSVFQERQKWEGIMLRGMKADFSWTRSARVYDRLYRKALAKVRFSHSRPEG